jgi:hypothetical protein
MGQSCARVVALKSATLVPLFVLKKGKARTIWSVSMTTSGGAGIALTIYHHRTRPRS